MKKNPTIIIFIILGLVSLLIFGLNYFSTEIVSAPIINSTQIMVGDQVWTVKIAETEEARVAGLSNQSSLREKTGLLFVFDQPDRHLFWMKDMLIPLDLIFFDENWKILLIESDLQPNSFPKFYGQGVKSKYVLEINAGEANFYGLRVGARAIFMTK